MVKIYSHIGTTIPAGHRLNAASLVVPSRLVKRAALAAVLAVGVSGIASADDSSMNPFYGESYAYFNGGNVGSGARAPTFDKSPSAWRQSNPGGWPEHVFQAYSAPGEAWNVHPVFASEASDPAYRETHPGGSTETELQALSSEAFGQRLAGAAGAAGIIAPDGNAVAEAPHASVAQRIATFIHPKRSAET